MYYKSTLDVKLGIKPVFTGFLHYTSYEGVCRTGVPEQLTLEHDRREAEISLRKFLDEMNGLDEKSYEILNHDYIELYDDFVMSRETIDHIAQTASPCDTVVFSGTLCQHPFTKFAMRYANPVIMYNAWHMDGMSFLRSIGRECNGCYTLDDLKYYLGLHRAKKAVSYMKVLNVEIGGHLKVGLKSSIYDLVGLERNLGIEFVSMQSEEVLGMFDDFDREHPDWLEEARQKTEEIIGKAEICNMTEENVLLSVKFYVLIKKLLEKYECNAFTMPCREICAQGRLMSRKMVFCLAHSLLKDDGIVTGCEGDMSAMTATGILMNLTRKAPHMGNNLLDNLEEGICTLHHDVPCVHMKGYDTELPYSLAHFTMAGWGASMRYDFTRDVGEYITLLKFDPSGKKMMAVRGTIIDPDTKYSSITEEALSAAVQGEIVSDTKSHTKPGCTMVVKYKVGDGRAFYETAKNYGHHFAMVFGDHTQELQDLAGVMNLGIDIVR